MFTEKKSDFYKPGEAQGHHKGAQPVSLLCIIRTCSLLVGRSSMCLVGSFRNGFN